MRLTAFVQRQEKTVPSAARAVERHPGWPVVVLDDDQALSWQAIRDKIGCVHRADDAIATTWQPRPPREG